VLSAHDYLTEVNSEDQGKAKPYSSSNAVAAGTIHLPKYHRQYQKSIKIRVMKTRILLYIIWLPAILAGCSSNKQVSDAQGTFEVDEVIVSAEVPGKILSLDIQEGSILKKDSLVGIIDPVPLKLQKAQVEATIGALHQKTMDVRPQIQALKDQIAVQKAQLKDDFLEKARTERLTKADAATTKQLDDINTAIAVLQKQIVVNEQQIKVQETHHRHAEQYCFERI